MCVGEFARTEYKLLVFREGEVHARTCGGDPVEIALEVLLDLLLVPQFDVRVALLDALALVGELATRN